MLNKDSKWIYDQMSSNGYDVGTEEHFSELLANEVDSKWIYDESTKLGLDLGDYDHFKGLVNPEEKRKLFPNASWDNLSWNNIKKSFGEGAMGGEVSQVSHSQAEEEIEKAEEERKRQEKINLGITDKDKQDVIELIELEQKAANPVSVSANGIIEVNTPEPVLNQYGMPTNVTKSVNPDVERQVETKKAQMPAYLTRGENTTMDITQNAYDRAMNTEEGKNIVTSIENKYKTEFKQSEAYKALLKDFYAGKVTEADINNAFVEQYGQKMNDDIREGILGENGLMREYYDDAQAKLNARLRETEVFEIEERIKKAEEKAIREAYKEQNGMYPEEDTRPMKWLRMDNAKTKARGMVDSSIEFGGESKYTGINIPLNYVKQARRFNEDALDLIDAVNNDRGFGKGFANSITDIDTFDMGIAELSRTKELIEILDKVEADEQLSEREELMLDAALNYFAVTSYYSNKLGRGYKAGQTTGASLPFIAQFMLTSGALAGAEAAVEGGAKALGKKIVKNLVKHGNKKFAKALSSKAVTVPLATIGGLAEAGLEAGVMTAVFGIPKIEAGTQSRMLGEVNTSYNPETGEMEYLGRTNVQDEKTARRNATIDTYVEYLSEMVLAKAFDPVGEWFRSTNMYKNILRTDIAGAIVDAWSHPTWKSIRTSTKFGSLPEEILEEELGGLLRLGLASDVNTAKEAGLDLDSQIDIVLGLAPTSIMFGAVGAGTYYGRLHRNAKHIRQSLSSDAQRELFDKLMEESRSGQFGDLAHDMIRNIVLDNEMPVEDKKASITSIVVQYQDLLSQETQKLAQQVNETENAANIDEYISNTRNNASDKIYQTIDSKGRVCSIVDGRVEISQNEYGWNQIDQDKSSNKVKVRYRKEDGSFTDPIEMLTSELTAPVNVMNTEKFKEMALAKSLASTKGEDTFEYDGVVYDTDTGIAQGTVEEYAQKEEERKKEEEGNNEPRVNTRPHKINGVFTVTIDGKKVDIKVYSNNATQKNDGSIKGGTFSISVDGKVVTGERREMYVEALSEKLKEDHAKAIEEYNQRKAAEIPAQQLEPVAEEPLVSEEDRAKAAAEAEKRAKIEAFQKDKSGNVLVDKLSPEEYFLYIEQEDGTETAVSFIADQLAWEYQAIADIEASNKSPREKQTVRMKHQSAIKDYEAAIVKYAGQETLDAINATRVAPAAPVEEGPAVPPVQAPAVEPAQDETPADAPAGPDTTPLPLHGATVDEVGTEGEREGDGETPAPDMLGEEGGVEGNEEGEEPASAADKPTANLDEVTVWVAKNYDYIVTDKEGNTIFSSKPTRKKVTDAFEELHQVEGKVDGKRGTYNGEDCIIVRDNPAKGYVNIVTPHGIERVGREEVMIDGKPLKGKASVVEWRENNEKKYDTFESIMNFPVFDIRGVMNITFLDFLNTQQNSPYVAFYEMLRKHYREKYNDDVAQQYLDASVARLIENLKEVARLWNIVRTKRLISSGQMPTTLERKKMDSQSKRMKEAVAAVHNAVGLDNSIGFSGLAELSEKAAKKAEKKGYGEGYFAETDEEKAESYVDGLVSNILWVGFESENKHEHKDAVEGIVEALNKESKKASKLRELVVNILNDRLEEAKRLNRLNDIQAIERVVDRLSTLKKMKPLLTEAGLIEEKGKKNAPAKPAPKKDTSALKKQLSIEENSLRDLEEDYKRETDEAEKSELEGYIAQAKEKIAKLKAEIDGAEFMVGNVAESSASQETKELALASEIQSLADSEDVEVINITAEQIEESNPLMTSKGVVYGYALGNKIYLTPDGMNTNTPVHEYTHIWAKAMQKNNPKAWKSIVEQLKKADALWNEVVNDPNYENIKGNDDAIASEVLSRYSGKNGADKLEAEAERVVTEYKGMEKGLKVKALISRVKKALEKFWSWVGKDLFKIESFESVESIADRVLYDMLNNTKLNLDNSKKSSTFAENNENYERTDEFRELQERSNSLPESTIAEYHSKERELSDEDRRRVGGVFQRLMDTDRNGGRNGQWINLTGKGNQFKMAQVNPAIFHDIFQICRNYLPNGELVDLHDNYADCKCFISEDGLCGFAIEPNGNLISVFSLNPSDKKGFLYAIKDLIRQEGATHLDCYVSSKQPLAGIYQKALGFHVASEMDYNMEYDHDNIAENHGMPKVAFMVDKPTEKREFDGESYDAAYNYQQSQTSTAEREQIIAEAKANGTFMTAPNGQPTNLTEDQWVATRTQAFKDYFGDWQNEPANASVVLDENGEPLVVYHGSRMAGFDKFGRGEARDSQGIYTTPNRRAAESYATSKEEWKSGQTMPEAELGVPDHHGVYSLFVNMRNPKIIDFGGKEFDRFGTPKYEVATNEAIDNGERGILFDTLEEAEAYIAEHPEEDLDYVEKYTTSDDLLVQAKEEGYDGVIFTNIIDSRYRDPITNYVPFEPNQVKSATQNVGNFNAGDDRIEFMIGPAASSGSPLDPMLFDAEAAAKIQIKTHKLLTTFANPKANLPKEFSAMRELIATSLDRTEGIRWMMDSIKQFRKEHGMPELGEGFDVRTMVEAMDSKIQNDTQAYINTTEKRLRKNIKKLADRVESSSFYKMHKIEREPDQDGKEVELTALQMIERYLIACDSIEREKLNGNPRGLADFYRRMGMDVYEFADAFNSAFFSSTKGKQQFDELWDSIRSCTNVSIDIGWQSGLISYEEYTEYKKRRYYVPERDFAEVENNEELAIDSHGYRGRSSNKLTAVKQAKGGDSLAANVLANICLHARDGIIKSHRNTVKKAMYDLLRSNEEWCREYNVPIPKQVWYQKNADGSVTRMIDGPSAEDKKLMADLKSQIRDIENEIINLQQLADAATDESVKEAYENDIADLREQIDMLTDMFPYLDEFDTRSFIFMTNAAKNESTVMVYVDGVAQEMIFPNMSIIAKALNGTYNREGELGIAKSVGQYFAAGLTVYNPAFFTVNIVRDVPFIMKKGFAEYGFTFGARFIARMAEKLFNRELWKVVWNSDYKSLKDEHLREFFAGGANTGYTTIPEIRELKKATKGWSKKTSVGWSDVKDLLSYMNTFSEVWTRSAAYSVVRDMGYTNEEAIKAAKNLSVNFNRKGLGNPFMNFFGSLSIFMNAAIQGACGYWRAFEGNEDTLPLRVWHGTRAAMQFMLLPAFTGFISTLLNPDDDKEKLYYSDYDRDNYALLGFLHEGIRIPLSEQVKPFWCMGVNIALGMQGRRTKEQITNSMVSTVVTNLLPLPPVLNSTIVMAANGLTGQKDFTPFQVVENMITPQALSGIYDLSNNVNFMGTDIRIEAGDRPQYMLGENEEYFCRQVAWWAYLISGGNRDYPSRTTTGGDKIWADWNPKQVSAVRNMLIPSTYRDVTDFFTRVIVNAASPDNPYHGEEAKWEDFATVRRFYKPRDREMGMYSITKDAKAIVKANNERKANAQKLVKGGAITKNNAMRDEAELRLRQTLSNRDVRKMSKFITIYEQLSIRENAKEYNLTEKQFMEALRKENPSAYNILIHNQNVKREDAANELLKLTRKYKSISIEDMTLLEAFGVEE